ncbi:MAG TPA: alpha/beta hydrolase [Polyangiaceae bacterium]
MDRARAWDGSDGAPKTLGREALYERDAARLVLAPAGSPGDALIVYVRRQSSGTEMTLEHRDFPQPTTRDVAARGARIRFAEAGSGPPLVLVHDYLASRVAWDDVLPRLAERFRVIVPDLPGFGESEKPSPSRYRYGFHGFSESLVDLLAALGLGRVSICGHAMGGAVALTLAASHAHIVEKLVLVNPLVYPPRPDALSRIAGVPLLGPLVFKQLYGRALFRARFAGSAAARRDHFFELFDVPAAREAAYATMCSMLDTRSLTASVPRVTAPALVAWGRTHRASPVDQGRRLARELGGARFEVFDCGSSPAEEVPVAFAAAVTSFLGSSAGGAGSREPRHGRS